MARCFENDGTFRAFNSESEIPKHLSILVSTYPPTAQTFEPTKAQDVEEEQNLNNMGLFSGPISIAYVLFLLANDLHFDVEGRSLLEWANKYLQVAKEVMEKSNDSSYKATLSESCGIISNPLCYLAVSAAIHQDIANVETLVSYAEDIASGGTTTHDGYTFGRAGYLYLLRLCLTWLPSSHALVAPAQSRIIAALLSRGPRKTSHAWSFFGKRYLGVAHGCIGILDQILRTDPSLERAAELRPMFVDIIKLQLQDGNWPNVFDETGSHKYEGNELIQWDFGSPGIVSSLQGARLIYAQLEDGNMVRMMDQAIERAQNVIWLKGLLIKESCLEHGAAGNSLSLTDPRRRGTFLAHSTTEVSRKGLEDRTLQPSSSPGGLHRGLAGTIWAMSEFQKGRNGIYASYNDL